jgi:predicted DNA binding CopG/RHH family protein
LARKKDKDKRKPEEPQTGWGREEFKEKRVAEGLKRSELDEGKVTLVDRDISTPVIETYDADTGELEGSILLKDGNREGLLGLVKFDEHVDVELDHDANIESINFKGNFSVENPSKKDRLWDIDLSLKNIESTNLKSNEIKIRELGTDDETNTYSEDFLLTREVKNLLLVKEYVNTLKEADRILNIRDIENDLLKVKNKTSKAGTVVKERKVEPEEEEEEEVEEEEEEEEEEDDEDEDDSMLDGGISSEDY